LKLILLNITISIVFCSKNTNTKNTMTVEYAIIKKNTCDS